MVRLGNSHGRRAPLLAAWTMIFFVSGSAEAQETKPAKKTFADGQEVQVREGDEWSKATIVAREGRKYQIRYEDGNEEWVAGDRLRAKGSAKEAPAAETTSEPETKKSADPAPKKPRRFTVNQIVEVNSFGQWIDGKIRDRKQGKFLITFVGKSSKFDKWVTADQVRMKGEGQTAAGEAAKPGAAETASADDPLSGARVIDVAVAGPSKFRPNPASEKSLAAAVFSFQATAKSASMTPNSFLVGGGAAFAMLQERWSPEKSSAYLERFDLASGASTAVWPITQGPTLLGVSPSGGRLLLRSDGFGFGKKGELDVYSIEGSEPKKLSSFKPYPKEEWKADVVWGAMIDDDHVLTLGGKDTTLALWELPSWTPKWRANLPWFTTPTLSPGGKHVIVATDKQWTFLDARTGKAMFTQPATVGVGSPALSPDGAKAAIVSNNLLTVWDFAQGAIACEIPVREAGWPNPVWVDDEFVLVDRSLVSISKRMVAWRYELADPNAKIRNYGGLTWFTSGDPSAKLVSIKLPDEQVRQATANLDPKKTFVLNTGDQASVEVNIDGNPDAAAKTTTSINNQLQSRGVAIAPGQAVKVIATVKPGATHDIVFHPLFGIRRGSVTKKVTSPVLRIAVEMDGKVCWEKGFTGTPGVLNMKNDDIDGAIAEWARNMPNWLVTVKLPENIPRAEFSQGLGKSQLTARGAEMATR